MKKKLIKKAMDDLEPILNLIFPPNVDKLIPDMDSRGVRQRLKNFIASTTREAYEAGKQEISTKRNEKDI